MNSSPMSYTKDVQQVRKQLKAEEVLFSLILMCQKYL